MIPRKERSDGVGPGRLGGISSFFHAHAKEGLLPVSDVCWMVHRDSLYASPECNQFGVSRNSGVDIPSASSTSALRPG